MAVTIASPVVRTGRGRAAFTLIELLVTMSVGLLLVVFLFQLFNASMRAWRQGEDQVETYREARAGDAVDGARPQPDDPADDRQRLPVARPRRDPRAGVDAGGHRARNW